MSNDRYKVAKDGVFHPVKELHVGVDGEWKKSRVKLVGKNGKWVEVHDHKADQSQGLVKIVAISQRGGYKLQDGVVITGEGFGESGSTLRMVSESTGVDHDVSEYIGRRTETAITFAIPELPVGKYQLYVVDIDGVQSGKFDFSIEQFKVRHTPLIIDFANTTDVDVRNNFMASHKGWGGANGGTHVGNTKYIRGQSLDCYAAGDLYTGPLRGTNGRGETTEMATRIGGCVVTRDYFGPGSYRVWVKPAEKTGVCNAIWTFHYQEAYEGKALYKMHMEDGLHRGGDAENGYYSVRNHEIDIEFPTALENAANMEDVSYKNARFNLWRGENLNWDVPPTDPAYWEEYNDNFLPHGANLDDGQVHELRFDWHLGDDPRVEFFIDGVHVNTNREQVPNIPGRFWLGLWFPSAKTHWAGRGANFDIETFSIKKIEITPFVKEYDRSVDVGETYPFDVFRDIPME